MGVTAAAIQQNFTIKLVNRYVFNTGIDNDFDVPRVELKLYA